MQICYIVYSGYISENLTRGANHTFLGEGGGGNMKTRVAVYEEGLFDSRGGKTF